MTYNGRLTLCDLVPQSACHKSALWKLIVSSQLQELGVGQKGGVWDFSRNYRICGSEGDKTSRLVKLISMEVKFLSYDNSKL
ncbi:hypothetical protein VTL71DRAFT_7139, partial [Oculimacula yallundae]